MSIYTHVFIIFYLVDDSDVDYIEQLVTQLSDAESEDATLRHRLHKPLDAVLSPLPQSPFAKVGVRDFCSDTDGSSSVSVCKMCFNKSRSNNCLNAVSVLKCLAPICRN